MNSPLYRGSNTSLIRAEQTITGVCLGQDSDGSIYAACGDCYHQIMPRNSVWRCSNTSCKNVYSSVPYTGSSSYSSHRFDQPDHKETFIQFVTHWTGLRRSVFTVEFHY